MVQEGATAREWAEEQFDGADGIAGLAGDGGPARSAQLNQPTGVAVDAAGNLYIADRINGRIRKVTKEGLIITTVAGSTRPAEILGGARRGPNE